MKCIYHPERGDIRIAKCGTQWRLQERTEATGTDPWINIGLPKPTPELAKALMLQRFPVQP